MTTALEPAHPEFESEQKFLKHAHKCLLAMRDQVKDAGDAGADPKASAALARLREASLDRLENPDSVLFGRLNLDSDEHYYVGPRGVRDAGDELIVINWAAPVAKPFYDATPSDPQGVRVRRRFRTEREKLLGIADERLQEPEVEPTLDDLLLDELSRDRTAEMRQIAATIQRDQYRIIERPLESTTIVQGGPGTGKTVVGLHRAALLLYRHREQLANRRVLIVGPNQLFMQYIAYVLPSLGETAADQVAVANLVATTAVEQDDTLVARVKGDERMTEVLRRAVVDRVRAPKDDVSFNVDGVVFTVAADVVKDMVKDYDARGQSYVNARLRFRAAFEKAALQAYEKELGRRRMTLRGLQVRTLPEFVRALDRTWPTISAPDLVRQFLSSEEWIDRAASEILAPTDRRLLYRKPVERLEQVRWSNADLPLIDEVQELLDPETRRYGHVIVDEAQDLTPMQLRMIGRRVSAGSVTVLGDLAQATGLWSYSTWEEVAEHLGVSNTSEVEELTYAYRVPAEIMNVALPVLELTAPSIAAPVPYRHGGQAPAFVEVERGARFAEAVARARAAHNGGGTTAIITPPSLLSSVREALEMTGVHFGDAERGELATSIELLEPTTSKGLEFDHVVLVEPAAVIREAEGQGQRDLYVALTRATRTLICVHSEPLPWPLGARQPEPTRPKVTEAVSQVELTGERMPPAPSSTKLTSISVAESLTIARMRHLDIDQALARALLARVRGASDEEVAHAVLNPDAINAAELSNLLSALHHAAGGGEENE
jgi:DNA helicase IV